MSLNYASTLSDSIVFPSTIGWCFCSWTKLSDDANAIPNVLWSWRIKSVLSSWNVRIFRPPASNGLRLVQRRSCRPRVEDISSSFGSRQHNCAKTMKSVYMYVCGCGCECVGVFNRLTSYYSWCRKLCTSRCRCRNARIQCVNLSWSWTLVQIKSHALVGCCIISNRSRWLSWINHKYSATWTFFCSICKNFHFKYTSAKQSCSALVDL
jgi:hypothetical protein